MFRLKLKALIPKLHLSKLVGNYIIYHNISKGLIAKNDIPEVKPIEA